LKAPQIEPRAANREAIYMTRHLL